MVLTGGEPMLFAELIPLTAELHRKKMHITIETAGTLYLPVACDLMSISPKLSNSTPSPERDPRWARRHDLNRHAPEVIRRLKTPSAKKRGMKRTPPTKMRDSIQSMKGTERAK